CCHVDHRCWCHVFDILLSCYLDHPALLSFPTRRSSDLNNSGKLGDGSMRIPFTMSSKWRWGPVEYPVEPTVPRRCSISTVSPPRSEEHTSELQSRFDLVCRLLLEKKKNSKSQEPNR